MGMASQPQIDGRKARLSFHSLCYSQGPPGGVVCKARLPTVTEPCAQARPQPVCANQRHSSLFARALRRDRGNGDAVLMQGEVRDARAEVKRNVRAGVDRIDQYGLQVPA